MKMLFKKIMRLDDSLRVCIPRNYATLVGLNPNDPVEVTVKKRTVTLKFLTGEAAEAARPLMPKKKTRRKRIKTNTEPEKGAN